MRKIPATALTSISIASLIVIAIALYFQRPASTAAAQTQDPLIQGALQSEADRIRAAAATDEQCLIQNAGVIPQDAKDKAIVACFVGRLRSEAIDRISRDSFRLEALEEIKSTTARKCLPKATQN